MHEPAQEPGNEVRLLPAGLDHKHACLRSTDVGGSTENSDIFQTAVKVSRDVPIC